MLRSPAFTVGEIKLREDSTTVLRSRNRLRLRSKILISTAMVYQNDVPRPPMHTESKLRAAWACYVRRLPAAQRGCLVPRRCDRVPRSTAAQLQNHCRLRFQHNCLQLCDLSRFVFYVVPDSTAQYRNESRNILQVRNTMHTYSPCTHTCI